MSRRAWAWQSPTSLGGDRDTGPRADVDWCRLLPGFEQPLLRSARQRGVQRAPPPGLLSTSCACASTARGFSCTSSASRRSGSDGVPRPPRRTARPATTWSRCVPRSPTACLSRRDRPPSSPATAHERRVQGEPTPCRFAVHPLPARAGGSVSRWSGPAAGVRLLEEAVRQVRALVRLGELLAGLQAGLRRHLHEVPRSGSCHASGVHEEPSDGLRSASCRR